ncbi:MULTISPECIES: 3-oxoacyl-ACP synthase III family protein [Methylosinus]|uniref:Beta-ketoacyl-ACP reductase n=1 Tax=Methylosinus trichosporium (strain ATCC 35070 / NCIMB 11131 / UNIQEM 75 / OB3b) TaxID=595536 RepID=A0A2D2D7F9_METT3|nr:MULTISPECIES: 3-oxoacyl-ACP synthase III family protein [Methylosinus]ATQ70961.1 beta-ketoacyl-ACP reductase [Methylosinus trichosporium OB3b]OBS54399.1 beta-ketoacyl-ACP reductase [Methylosinus sp. 3S-1]
MRLVAFSEELPGAPVTNSELAASFGLHEQWLDQMTGNRSRHFCRLDAAPGAPRSAGDLATAAGAKALSAAGVAAEELEFLILTTASPDHLMPATVNLVADRLGVDGVPTLQITSGCAGALQGLFVARALLAGGLRRGLVIGADTCLKLWPSKRDLKQMKPAEMVNFALFGDGAGAAVVEAGANGPGLFVEHLFLRTVGRGRKPAQIVRWFGADGAQPSEPMGEEDYKAIERHVPEMAAAILAELVSATGWPLAEVDYVLTPQLNGVMTEKIRAGLGVRPEQAVSCVAETGNNGNALPFIQMRRLADRIETGFGDGARVFVATVESSKWIMSGMALRYAQEIRHAA